MKNTTLLFAYLNLYWKKARVLETTLRRIRWFLINIVGGTLSLCCWGCFIGVLCFYSWGAWYTVTEFDPLAIFAVPLALFMDGMALMGIMSMVADKYKISI